MIEVHMTYDVKKGIDEKEFFEWMKKAILPALLSPGIIELRACVNVKRESPEVLVASLWNKLEDWTAFEKSEAWKAIVQSLQNKYAGNVHLVVWKPSPVMPTPLKPHR